MTRLLLVLIVAGMLVACGGPRPYPATQNAGRPVDGWDLRLCTRADLAAWYPQHPDAVAMHDPRLRQIWVAVPDWVASDARLRAVVAQAIASSWHELGHHVEHAYPDIWRRHLAAFEAPGFSIITDEQRREGLIP